MAVDQNITHAAATAEMSDFAGRFVDTLDSTQKSRTCFPYMDGERIFWYYPPLNRHGLALRDMNDNQRDLAFGLLAAGLTDSGNAQAKATMQHEIILGEIEKNQGKSQSSFRRDPDLYYWRIFGDPTSDEPWGWSVEGHHVSIHYSIWKDKVISITPFFFGSNPAEVPEGPHKGLRLQPKVKDLAFDLIENLDKGQQSSAIIFDEAPLDILTFNAARASLPKEQGLAASKMNSTQKEILTALITEYTSKVRSEIADSRLDTILSNLDGIHFAWGGPVDKSQAHYYRLHGGDFVVEYDNRQNGANHIHSVWRDVSNDFAGDVMRDHLYMYHVL
jgi:hypothetical protein